MMIDAPGIDEDEDKSKVKCGLNTEENITLTEDNAEEVMRYFNNMIG